eukprot:5808080-Pleurochrysis_carterae.AAC.1
MQYSALVQVKPTAGRTQYEDSSTSREQSAGEARRRFLRLPFSHHKRAGNYSHSTQAILGG